MVRYKAKSAYCRLLAPCIVEHAGLVLKGYEKDWFPGGLTQPMWDALGPENFVRSLTQSGTNVIAKAVVGYCDGRKVKIFSGETTGTLVSPPRGTRNFYWDPIFCPDENCQLTYSEIIDKKGIQEKIKVSQSAQAMKKFLRDIFSDPPDLFR